MSNSLFNEFPDSSLEQWKERLAKDLKGIGFDDLSTVDRNGLPIFPFYTGENGRQLPARFAHQDWNICSRIKVTEPSLANAQALKELKGGANALCFVLSAPVDYEVLLKDIDTDIIHLRLEFDFDNARIDYPGAGNPERCTPVVDPISRSMKQGNIPADYSHDLLSAVKTGKCLSIDGAAYQNAGASTSYEIACVLAHTNEYLNLLHRESALETVQQLNVRVATGTLFFEEIAKLRALRSNLESLLSEYDMQADIYLHVESSDLYRSAFDVHSNLLRDSIAGMAAVIGGCNGLSLHPFDAMASGSSELSSRMSRNQQLIFKEESYLNRVADMAAGSFYLDELTDRLADISWEMFHQMEASGGFIAGLSDGSIPDTIAQQADALIAAYRSGEKVLIGVNKYPNPTDPPKAVEKTSSSAPAPLIAAIHIPEILTGS